jgi:hypothetical protein
MIIDTNIWWTIVVQYGAKFGENEWHAIAFYKLLSCIKPPQESILTHLYALAPSTTNIVIKGLSDYLHGADSVLITRPNSRRAIQDILRLS